MYRLLVVFYRSGQGQEPVRDWLERDLWEVRIGLRSGTARVLFTTHNGAMVLLHGFAKKSQKTPRSDLELARTRLKEMQRG